MADSVSVSQVEKDILMFRALAGWRFEGMLCEADDIDTGAMWECPLLVALPRVPDGPRISAIPRRQSSGSPGSGLHPLEQQRVRSFCCSWVVPCHAV